MVPTLTAIVDATPVGHVPFSPVDVACAASCVTFTAYVPARVPSAAEMNVMSGLADDPPCVNIAATFVGLALYAARNLERSKLKLPVLSADTPTRPGLTSPLPPTASSSALGERVRE